MEITHRVRVFVFSIYNDSVLHLLVRRKPRREWSWGPLAGPIGMDEQFHQAVRRQVDVETGLKEGHVVDLCSNTPFLFGEVGTVDWDFGFRIANKRIKAVEPAQWVQDFCWEPMMGVLKKIGAQEGVLSSMVRLEMLHQRAC